MKDFISCLVMLSLGAGCQKTAQDQNDDTALIFSGQPSLGLLTFEELSMTGEPIIPQQLKQIFCGHIFALDLKQDFSREIGFVCQAAAPSTGFDAFDLLAQNTDDQPKAIGLGTTHTEKITTAYFGTAIRAKLKPKHVRLTPVQGFMSQSSSYDYLELEAGVTRNRQEEVGGDLRISSYDLFYKTRIDTRQNYIIINERQTQFNNYQVQGGNPDIGFAGEHLTGSTNSDFVNYNIITIILNDGNDSSILISIIGVTVDHRGFPKITEQAISDIAASQAKHLQTGLAGITIEGGVEP